ncbi:hypothetical protein NCS57_00029600 [Fusarium keratoplasticum]|uniref:Uncharacterized protein n=1 Tax=Fusarium keratoplasticum TaxID=1328300 RepID=A0ACC0RBR1_9HYPO|nr:hypothetical protein NCS57_00029600 [Fusarium keratoplasticum]KAI8683649.1 hypothetical protein NCS57_00029600 [Fusarium keratoplasticum]
MSTLLELTTVTMGKHFLSLALDHGDAARRRRIDENNFDNFALRLGRQE